MFITKVHVIFHLQRLYWVSRPWLNFLPNIKKRYETLIYTLSWNESVGNLWWANSTSHNFKTSPGCNEAHSTLLYIFNAHSLLMLQNPSKQPVVCEEFSLGVKHLDQQCKRKRKEQPTNLFRCPINHLAPLKSCSQQQIYKHRVRYSSTTFSLAKSRSRKRADKDCLRFFFFLSRNTP